MKKNVYQIVTDRIIELLEQGTVPWHKPWSGGVGPMNMLSKRPYRGINHFLLNVAAFASPYWLTLNQANRMGGRIKKGEKSTIVVFWKVVERKNEETGKTEERPVLRYYRVFNFEQTDGINMPDEGKPEEKPFTPIEHCESIVKAIPNPPKIQHKSQAAWYKPKKDLVNMPKPESFESAEEYYSTLFHEAAHSTGHESRLNRLTLNEMAPFGSTNYSKEELVAELCAAMLCGETGIVNSTIDNSASYINGWLQKLKKDNKLVVTAAAQAQKAADYITGRRVNPSDTSN